MNIQFRFGDDLESIKELGPRIYSPVLRVVSNFGDGDSEAGETYTHARNYEETRGGERKIRPRKRWKSSLLVSKSEYHTNVLR